jgi:hypothetical protein
MTDIDWERLKKHPNLQKGPCCRCGEECFSICFLGYQRACLDCWTKVANDVELVQKAIADFRLMLQLKPFYRRAT